MNYLPDIAKIISQSMPSIQDSLSAQILNGGKKRSIKHVIEEISDKEKSANHELDDNCIICNKKINNHTFHSLRKYSLSNDYDEEDELTECKNFCSVECLNVFLAENGIIAEEYEMYEVQRCSTFYDCHELGNSRKICERIERLDYEPANNYIAPMRVNFCEPANAGIIKASVIIKKQLDESSKQNSIHFILTAAMTFLVIILTMFNIYLILINDGGNQLDIISTKLSEINNNLLSFTSLMDSMKDGLNSNVNLINDTTKDTIYNSNNSINLVDYT